MYRGSPMKMAAFTMLTALAEMVTEGLPQRALSMIWPP